MHFLRIDEAATRADLEQAISHLRAKQRASRDEQVIEEIRADVDELLDLLGVSR